jgi:hypothetical protein
MGTVLRVGRFSFRVYSNEPRAEPPHIHVICDRTEAKFMLTPLHLASVHGMAQHDVRDAAALVAKHRDFLERTYRELHPDA